MIGSMFLSLCFASILALISCVNLAGVLNLSLCFASIRALFSQVKLALLPKKA